MFKNIICLLITCVFFGFSAAANAEGKFPVPFKSPFGLFSGKKGEAKKLKKEEKSDVKLQAEQIEKEKPKMRQKDNKDQKVFNPKNSIGITYAENTIDKVAFYIEEGDYESAENAIESINEWIFDATEFHTDLFKTLKRLENSEVQANIERDLAIKFAVLRDRTLFLESKVLINKGKNRHAVENLVEVVRSQPATDLGFKAYELLQNLGFTYKIEYEMIKE